MCLIMEVAPVLRLRDEVLPVADLDDLLGLDSARDGRVEERLVVVMRVAAATFGR